MRVLQISSAKSLGGGETHVIELVGELRRLGHHVVVAGRASGPLQPDIALPFLNSADVYSALRLRSIIRKGNYDVVHAHVARDYTLVAAAALGLDVKVVFTRHLLYPVKKHFLYRRVDGWLAPTSQILRTLSPLKPKVSDVVPNWVDVSKFAFRPHVLHEPVNIGLLGQISPHKGHDDAIEAIRDLGPGFRLLIAGKGEPSYVEALKRRSAGLPVEFLGFVSLPDFFEMVDVLAVPSWEEPFGIVLLEAMASGIPLVSTACGGPLDIVESEEHGLLVPPKSPQKLAQAIHRLGGNPALREHVIQSARKRVEMEYDIHEVVARIVGFYERLQAGEERLPS
jgi:glycosyltransferase involved in cell wall biosynthesis